MKLHKRFLKSLYSLNSISHFRLFGVGSTIMYVLLLTFICMIPMAFLFLINLFSNSKGQLLSNFHNYGLNQEQMQQFAESMSGIMPIVLVVIYFTLYILLSGILFSGVSVLSFVGLIFSKLGNKKLTYRHLWVISCYSITLPVVLLTIIFAFNVQIPYSFLWFWMISCIILVLSINNTPVKK
ncbi:DUF1189 family protein [Bacillus sp. NEB1478]|uniref:DUF1189 family protein n=1 Tax=Bacillus sp. NEB1478 TaxID=3073816 RepID=UPI002873A5DB|nr:DUF1189 family protein [Bacillus sp. NEB1478]WNB93518.1 DUF1189 family protein [Bacillus sp. NEB1478]